jgi:serine/threonine protein phosphatase 1
MEHVQDQNRSTRLYAIGDIHGCLDLLDRAVAAIHHDVEKHGPGAITVTLGDYIDRGPDSRGVLDRLAANPFPTSYVALKGNHESMFEDFLADPSLGRYWASQGGEETLLSYGIAERKLMRDYERAAELLPEAHARFLRSLKLSFSHGNYFLCHAGVRPGIPLESQSDQDLLWIRDEFLDSTLDFGKIIVHGHTPVAKPELRPNRINIDTGAFATGRLTCVALDEDGHRFLSLAG